MRLRSAVGRLARAVRSQPELVTWIDRTMFAHLNKLQGGATVLNVGSGVGAFDHNLRAGLRLINLDIVALERTALVGDAHSLPIATCTVDAVLSNAVLEHVRRPWVVAAELIRVVKPGGLVAVNAPFLNVIHDAHDYFRFTDGGLDVLFEPLEKVASGVSSGPGSFFGVFAVEWLMCLAPSNRLLRAAMRRGLSWLMWPVQFTDWPLRRNAHLRVTADAFYYVGRKPA